MPPPFQQSHSHNSNYNKQQFARSFREALQPVTILKENQAGKVYYGLNANTLAIEFLDNSAKSGWFKLLSDAMQYVRQMGVQKLMVCSQFTTARMDHEQMAYLSNTFPVLMKQAGIQYACLLTCNDAARIAQSRQLAKKYSEYMTTDFAENIQQALQWLEFVSEY